MSKIMKIRINSKYAKIPPLKNYKNRKIREDHENGIKKKKKSAKQLENWKTIIKLEWKFVKMHEDPPPAIIFCVPLFVLLLQKWSCNWKLNELRFVSKARDFWRALWHTNKHDAASALGLLQQQQGSKRVRNHPNGFHGPTTKHTG